MSPEDRFGEKVRDLVRERARAIAARWLKELVAQLPEPPRRVFPSETLLNHIPKVLERVADAAIGGPEILEDETVRNELRDVVRLRRDQGYETDEIVREFDLLGRILFDEILLACRGEVEVPPAAALVVAQRIQAAIDAMSLFAARIYRDESTSDRLDRALMLHGFGRAVTHELRNRLQNALLTIGVLRAQLGREEENELFDRLESTVQRMGEVVEDVFVVAIAHGRADPVQERRQPLLELVRAVVADLDEYAKVHEVAIDIDESGLPEIPVDAVRLQLVLVNLVGNAIKYSDREKTPRWVRISARPARSADTWWLDVADNGIGIPDDLQDAVFERRVRGDHDDLKGLGLGLALAREATEQLGGALKLASRKGEGTTFSVLLRAPRHELDPDDE